VADNTRELGGANISTRASRGTWASRTRCPNWCLTALAVMLMCACNGSATRAPAVSPEANTRSPSAITPLTRSSTSPSTRPGVGRAVLAGRWATREAERHYALPCVQIAPPLNAYGTPTYDMLGFTGGLPNDWTPCAALCADCPAAGRLWHSHIRCARVHRRPLPNGWDAAADVGGTFAEAFRLARLVYYGNACDYRVCSSSTTPSLICWGTRHNAHSA
jgi:hypothetical protein